MSAELHAAGECCTHCAPEPPRSTAAQARGVLATLAAVLLAAGCLGELAGGRRPGPSRCSSSPSSRVRCFRPAAPGPRFGAGCSTSTR